MANIREIKKIDKESVPVITTLRVEACKILDKWAIPGDRRWVDTGKFATFMDDFKKILDNHTAKETTFKTNSCTEPDAKEYKEIMSLTIKELRGLVSRLETMEDDFSKYNVPRPHRFESFGASVEALRAFMKFWKEETERGVERGYKCLMEWLQPLDQSEEEEKKNTFQEIRLVAANIGFQISCGLGGHCLRMALLADNWDELAEIFQQLFTVIQSLGVDKHSPIIERFLASVIYAYKTLEEDWIGVVSSQAKDETCDKAKETAQRGDVLHLILREVLRLEIAFCCADLPMMVTSEVFLGMGNYMREVFDKNIKKVGEKAKEIETEFPLKLCLEDCKRFELTHMRFSQGFQIIWFSNLKLRPSRFDVLSFKDET